MRVSVSCIIPAWNEAARLPFVLRAVVGHPAVDEVIVVDDGIATGSTMSAAIELLRKRKAVRIVVAAPVAPHDTIRRLRGEADEVVVLLEPADFMAVGRWYEDFSQTSDEDVRRLMADQKTRLAFPG